MRTPTSKPISTRLTCRILIAACMLGTAVPRLVMRSHFVLTFMLFLSVGRMSAAGFAPDFKLKPDDYTVLMAVDAKLSAGLAPWNAGGHGKFFLQGWQRPDQQAEWKITASEAADYAVQVLVNRNSNQELRLEVTAAGKTITGTLPPDARRWQRIALPGTIPFPSGESSVTLRLAPADGSSSFDAQVHAVELVRPAVRSALHQKALALRADTTWFQQARYGVMMHWTKQSMPRHGDPKPYAQAVADFNVEGFADQVRQTGAGFVVLTTSHAMLYFPAPLASLEKILPGRTSQRDLVADLAAALGKRGIKLMLYYHLGASDDSEWLKASGFWETDTSRCFGNWQAIISEAGERYQDKLAGWWFDDGSTSYYYRSAPGEQLVRAAKAGFPQRLVAFNPWVLNSPTEFQDFFTGEGFEDPRGYNELLVRGGNGRYPSGTHQGLQASACLVTEGDWVHSRKDTAIGNPRWKPEQLAAMLQGFSEFSSVPIFNLEIYQEGTLSPATVDMLHAARELVKARK